MSVPTPTVSLLALFAAVTAAGSVGHAQDARAPSRNVPMLEVWYRHATLAVPGGAGGTHLGGIGILPLHGLQALRWVRLEVGVELGAREGANGHTDVVSMGVATVGVQLPTSLVVPFVAGVLGGGFAVEERFQRTFARGEYTLGVEAGADLRAGLLGIGLAVGYGRAVEGGVYADGAWIRGIIPFY